MGDTLFGSEKSGTPIETRAGTKEVAGDILSGGGRLQSGAGSGLGFSRGGAGNVGVERAVMSLLNPNDDLRGLFAALQPFQARETEDAVAGTRSGFGRLGARFSRNADEAESRTRGELAQRFDVNRGERTLQAGALQSQTLAALFQALLGERGQNLGFFQPGQPNFQEGIAGDLLSAGGNVGAAAIAGSSMEFKDDIRPVEEDSVALFENLDFFRFRYKGDETERYGIILENETIPDQFKKGNFVDMTEVTFHLANAVKQLSARVAELEN